MDQPKVVLALCSHPDDAEAGCGGALALLHERGWQIHTATMTPGDCGSKEYNREQISEIRRTEAAKAAKILQGQYHCLECSDVFIMYDRPTLCRTIGLMRKIQPAIVFTSSPDDYMVDHTTTSKIVMTACFACGISNIEIEGTESFEPTPYLYYVDPIDNKDKFGNEIKPQMVVDISASIETKERMLRCHESQASWLLQHQGVDSHWGLIKSWAVSRGKLAGVDFGEGFRQHLGHGFGQDNILESELAELVHLI